MRAIPELAVNTKSIQKQVDFQSPVRVASGHSGARGSEVANSSINAMDRVSRDTDGKRNDSNEDTNNEDEDEDEDEDEEDSDDLSESDQDDEGEEKQGNTTAFSVNKVHGSNAASSRLELIFRFFYHHQRS